MGLNDAMARLLDSLGRGKGSFELLKNGAPSGPRFLLVLAAPSVAKVPRGYAITLGLNREQVEHLRAVCEEFLAVPS